LPVYFEDFKVVKNINEKNNYPFKAAKLNNKNKDVVKQWYIEFWAWSIDEGRLKRKRMFHVNKLKSFEKRMEFAQRQMREINKLLSNGYFFDEKTRKNNIQQKLIKENKIRLTIKEELLKLYDETKNAYRKKTNQATKTIINRFDRYICTIDKNYTITDVTLNDAKGFQAYLLNVDGIANVTVNKSLSYIKKFFNEFVKDERINKNPFLYVKGLPVQTGKKNEAFTKEQTQRLKSYIMKYDLQLWYFIQFIFWTYLRPKEIRNLRVKHILLVDRKIFVPANISKNKKGDFLYVPDALYRAIKEMNLDYNKPNNYVFSGKNYGGEEKLGVNNMYKRFKGGLIDLEFDGNFTLYSWKHTGVTMAYKAGIDIKAIQYQCRHHSIEMTDIYLKSLGFGDNKGFMNKINKVKL
jgi:integrase